MLSFIALILLQPRLYAVCVNVHQTFTFSTRANAERVRDTINRLRRARLRPLAVMRPVTWEVSLTCRV